MASSIGARHGRAKVPPGGVRPRKGVVGADVPGGVVGKDGLRVTSWYAREYTMIVGDLVPYSGLPSVDFCRQPGQVMPWARAVSTNIISDAVLYLELS